MTDANMPFLEEEVPQRKGRLGIGSIVLLVGILAVIGVVGLQLSRQNQTQPTSGSAPDFTIETFDGGQLSLSDLRGKVVVINFWASWCGPCRVEAPDLQRIYDRYKDRGVEVVGITYADIDADSLDFIDEFSLTYPNGPDRDSISDRYNIQGVPESFVIDQNGDIAHFIYAPTNEAALSAMIDDLLAA